MAHRRRNTVKMRRRTFMLDEHTLKDLSTIQAALRATSATEALRHAIRRYSDLVEFVSDGRQVQIVAAQAEEPLLQFDVPQI